MEADWCRKWSIRFFMVGQGTIEMRGTACCDSLRTQILERSQRILHFFFIGRIGQKYPTILVNRKNSARLFFHLFEIQSRSPRN